MTVPCLTSSPAIQLVISPTTGRLTANLILYPVNNGLEITTQGLRIDAQANGGINLSEVGASISLLHQWTGWGGPDAASDFFANNQSVGFGQYVQVGGVLGLNIARRAPHVDQTIEIKYNTEVTMALADPTSSNSFYGWTVALERKIDAGAWKEVTSEGASGHDNAVQHHLSYAEDFHLPDASTHQVFMRLTVRGGSAGTAVVRSTEKRRMSVRYL